MELMRFSDQRVSFERFHGPCKRCNEYFALVTLDDGSNAIEHGGQFVMRGGVIGWLLGRLVVRRLFDDHVASHMEIIARESR